MDIKDNLRSQLASNHNFVKSLLDDITEEESMYQGHDSINHIRWQAGHLVANADLILKLLGNSDYFPAEWKELFKRGSEISSDPNAYPPLSEIRTKLYSAYGRQLKLIKNTTIEDLYGKQDIIPFHDTKIDAILFFCKHEFYHLGQIMNVRRMLGRERTFG